jgi:pheromone shutdown protein TraB
MSKIGHKIFIIILVTIVLGTLVFLIYMGASYYRLSLEERYDHPAYTLLKPSGLLGHGMGIIGTFMVLAGVLSYMARKRYHFLLRMGILKHWLEFHIFLCTLGPILILFHTSFKIGGLVAISFWSMIAVFFSGVIGRFIYIQIPHSIEGRELNLNEIREMKNDIADVVKNSHNLDEESHYILTESFKRKVGIYHKYAIVRLLKNYFQSRKTLKAVRSVLKKNHLPKAEYVTILSLVKEDISINRKIDGLDTMHNLFKYWHVVHSPFALMMFIIMTIHVAVTIVFGYRWIF